MELSISLLDEQDIYLESAYLALGYLTIKSRGLDICLFNDKYCMVFLTSTSLLAQCYELLAGTLKQFELVADGYGACLKIEKSKGLILISNRDIVITVKSSDFFSSLFTDFGAIIRNLKNISAQSTDEGFNDLFNHYDKFSNLFSSNLARD